MTDTADRRDKPPKSDEAFRTIGEAALVIGVAQHVLRFWESRFSQLQPLKRGGNRRYYRPADMQLLEEIRTMLHDDGLTIRGAQQLLAARCEQAAAETGSRRRLRPAEIPTPVPPADPVAADRLVQLRAIRDRLRGALAA